MGNVKYGPAETTRERSMRLIKERDIARKQRDHALGVLEHRTKERDEALAKLEVEYGRAEYWHTRFMIEKGAHDGE
jgi:hypothetical protein